MLVYFPLQICVYGKSEVLAQLHVLKIKKDLKNQKDVLLVTFK